KIGPDPRNFNQRVSLGRNDLLIRTFLSTFPEKMLCQYNPRLGEGTSTIIAISLFIAICTFNVPRV
ncbi:hypothetical protein U4K75_06275, partial [Klebsiella pneumoniae]|nr:hypothetical protein [Klebsiella pneumoniae]MDZ5870043.1 hypothetical protein [Klebsiella pneumoniae]MDZ5879824.1 hypothetical protein [Klebsiella pneumoniae]